MFRAHPSGAISELEIFPHLTEEGFLLLQPDNVERMVVSLRAHRTELEVMSEADVACLESWRELCARDSGRMVAYLFDS